MKFCKYICFVFVCLFYIIIFFAIGYLANLPLLVLKIFFIAMCSFFVFTYFWGGQIVLAIVKAQKLPQEFFRHKVDNVSCLLGLSQVNIYSAKELPSGVYVLKGVGGSSHILFGGDAFEHWSSKELDALFHLSILKIKRLNLRFIQGCNFFFFVVNLPGLLMRRIVGLRYFCLAIEFFLLPLKRFKELVFRDDGRYLKDSVKKLEMDGMENIVGTILFKLKSFPLEYSRDVHRILLSGLSAVEEES